MSSLRFFTGWLEGGVSDEEGGWGATGVESVQGIGSLLTRRTDTGGSSSPPPSWRSREGATRSRETQSLRTRATMFRANTVSLQWLGREFSSTQGTKLRGTLVVEFAFKASIEKDRAAGPL